MGIRTAKLEHENTWVVYHSVTMALFEPMFSDEMSACVFARHLSTVGTSHADWQKDYAAGGDVQLFVKESYGGADDFDESEVYSDEIADVAAGTRRGEQILSELVAEFNRGRNNRLTFPVPVRQLQPLD